MRVIENPTCRWSTYHCNDNNIDVATQCPLPDDNAFAGCCQVPRSIQERAWSSPIWAKP
jgi:Protein of unknown function (DUF3604)